MPKKFIVTASLFCLLFIILAPSIISAAGLVPCDGTLDDKCEWKQLAAMLGKIYDFIVGRIATPLAILALVVGGIILMASAGDPKAAGLGKTMIWSAIIGLLLALSSKLIINFVLNAIGATKYNVQ